MMFNIIVDKAENKIIGITKGFSIDADFLDRFYNGSEAFGKVENTTTEYYAMVDVDFNLLQEFSDDFKKIQETLELNQILYPNELESKEWEKNHDYLVNDTVIYDGFLYRVVQAHKSQADWLPDKVPNLYSLMGKEDTAGKIKEWKQPTGAHDAYNIGDKVLFNGKIYESLINGNATVPGSDPRWWKLI